jgi:hypothetical protein
MSELTAFWIVTPFPHGPLGFGVTAHSFEDALWIIRAKGYVDYLPHDQSTLKVKQGIAFSELDRSVASRIGPIVVRGLWYPFTSVGMSG